MKILRYAEEIELIDDVPRVRPMRVPPQKVDFFSFEEYDRLVRAATPYPDELAMILLAGDCGLRKGEIAALEQGDVDLHARRLTVRRNVWLRNREEHVTSPKSGRDRTIEMSARLVMALRTIRHLRGERWFYMKDSGCLTPKSMEARLKRIAKLAGLRHIGWHVLRHTFCSHLAMSGADSKTIQEFAGHSSLAMTLRYMHLSPAHKRDAIDRLERVHLEHRGHLLGTGPISPEPTACNS